MDDSLTQLEHRFRATGDPAVEAALQSALRRAGLPLTIRIGVEQVSVTARALQVPATADLTPIAQLRCLRALAFSAVGETPPPFAALLELLDELADLEALGLRYRTLRDPDLDALASSDALQGLDSLDLGYTQLSDAGLATLAEAGCLGSLSTLHLQANSLSAACVPSLVKATQLETLDLRRNSLGVDGARALAASPVLRGLTSLQLYTDDVGGADGARALIDSPTLPHSLRRIWLSRLRKPA